MNRASSFRQLLSLTTLACFSLLLILPQIVNAELMKSERKGAKLHLRFLYMLSDFSGTVPSQWARLEYDQQHNEVFTLDPRSHEIRIYNKEGMEIFAYGGQGEIPPFVDIASGDTGMLYGLTKRYQENAIHTLNYRGEPKSMISLQGLPEEFAYFSAERLEYHDGRFYLLDSEAMKIVIISSQGEFEQSHDLGKRLRNLQEERDPEGKKLSALDISNFTIDSKGGYLFTVPQLFSVFRLNDDGTLSHYGKSGSAPGKFGVVSGIAVDEQGYIYITDRLRSVAILFDANFQFQGEFGYRGGLPEDLIVPDDIVVDQQGNRVFISQASNKGVGVYRVIIEPPLQQESHDTTKR